MNTGLAERRAHCGAAGETSENRARFVSNVVLETKERVQIARHQCDFPGGMLSIDLRGGKKAAFEFLRNLRIARNAVSLGGVETLVCHPKTTTHSGFTEEEFAAAGVTDGLVRISIGIDQAGQPGVPKISRPNARTGSGAWVPLDGHSGEAAIRAWYLSRLRGRGTARSGNEALTRGGSPDADAEFAESRGDVVDPGTGRPVVRQREARFAAPEHVAEGLADVPGHDPLCG